MIHEKNDKLDFTKVGNSYCMKDSIKKMERQDIDWEHIPAKDTSSKGLLHQTYKELSKFNNKKNK